MKKCLILMGILALVFSCLSLSVMAQTYENGTVFAMTQDQLKAGNPEIDNFKIMKYDPATQTYALMEYGVGAVTDAYAGGGDPGWYCLYTADTLMHPGAALYPVIAFTAPVAGNYTLFTQLTRHAIAAADATGSRFVTYLNDEAIKTFEMKDNLPHDYEVSFDAQAGETVYFVYDPIDNNNANDMCTVWDFKVTLNQAAAEDPGENPGETPGENPGENPGEEPNDGQDDNHNPGTADVMVGVIAASVALAAAAIVITKKQR